MGGYISPRPEEEWQIPDAEVRQELARILSGSVFAKVERPGRFLRHLVETALVRQPHLLKESLLGVEVFDRAPDWDPRLDPVVRQEAGRLRKRLSRHYETAGAPTGIRIDLPVGTYVPVFRRTGVAEEHPAVSEILAPAPASPRRARALWLGIGITLAMALGGAFLLKMAPRAGRSPSPEAQEFYRRGLYEWQKRTPESLTRAVDQFTQAIVRDPQYALAYTGLADCYNLLREFSVMPERDAYPRALAATEKALELDDRSTEAHASLAFISYWWNWNAAIAEREFRRAIALNPSYATARHWYATFLSSRRRHVEALAQIDAAKALDPSSFSIAADQGALMYFAGRSADAVSQLKGLEAQAPDLRSIHRYLAFIYLNERDDPAYLAESRRSAELARDEVSLAIWKAASAGYAAGGSEAMLRRILEAQIELHRRGQMDNYSIAQTCARLGRTAEAMDYLEASSADPGSAFLGFAGDISFRQLQSDARFQRLVNQFEPRINAGTIAPPH